ncbi:hypothetical protein C5S53_04545 [Methanophagales archaeon]|nr:hypothetical protein C5S53_04545 [Methanophagales archaeon]
MSAKVYRVPVYDEGKIVARVEYNNNLDWWDGHNFTSGSIGRHLGLTRLKDGSFVLIYGTQFEGETSYADIVSEETAFQAALKSGNEEILNKYFKEKLQAMDKLEEVVSE